MDDVSVESYVPSRAAYLCAIAILFFSGISGGLIGHAMMVVFFPSMGSPGRSLGTVIIAAGILYGVSVITSLGLQASVEWKSRQKVARDSQRPSRILRQKN